MLFPTYNSNKKYHKTFSWNLFRVKPYFDWTTSVAGVDWEQQEAHSFAASSISEESEGFHHQVHQVQVHHPPTTESIVGLMNCVCVANPFGRNYFKRFNCYLRKLARQLLTDFHVLLSPELRAKLLLWLKLQVLNSYVPWHTPPPSVKMFTDASITGWGFHSDDHHQGKGHGNLP